MSDESRLTQFASCPTCVREWPDGKVGFAEPRSRHCLLPAGHDGECQFENDAFREGAGSPLIRLMTPREQDHRYNDCCWTWVGQPNCVRLPFFRLATPHGEMDFCPDHIDQAIASLPPEWIGSWAFREPVAMEEQDDIPF